MTAQDVAGQPGGPPRAKQHPRPRSRNVWMGAGVILLLALIAGDPRVLLLGIPPAIALGLSAWADHRTA